MKWFSFLLLILGSHAHASGYMKCSGEAIAKSSSNISLDQGRSFGLGESEIVLVFSDIHSCKGHSCLKPEIGDWWHVDANELAYVSAEGELSPDTISFGNTYAMIFTCWINECQPTISQGINESIAEKCRAFEKAGKPGGNSAMEQCFTDALREAEKAIPENDCDLSIEHRIQVMNSNEYYHSKDFFEGP